MAPKRGESIERTPEHEEFMDKLIAFHKERGTSLDRTPKVGIRHIDLYKLYNRVVEEGGYDLCSDTKAKPLMWRTFAEEFVGKNVYTAAQAFQVKNVYYKNLCAYEIRNHWDKEPPPKEILEEVTAKGGNVMTRTLENFVRPGPREPETIANGDAGEASPEMKTPGPDKLDGDDPGSATGRTRGLRQQPPQRVLFQPDLTSSRQSRTQSQVHPSIPSPALHGTMGGAMHMSMPMNGAPSSLANYEPSRPIPLNLKPVITPANKPDFYQNERKRKLEANSGPLARKYRNIMLPGTGFIGPNIYVRAQLALQSGIAEEESYALHHLVKISHERGDKYRFDQFPGLAEALLKKILQVAGLFYDVEWEVSYDDNAALADETLNGLTGTPNLLEKLKACTPLLADDSTLEPRLRSELNRIIEAGLIIRNMSLQDENAAYLSRLPLTRDVIAVVLNLPRHSAVVELRHYLLDMTEQVVKEVDLGAEDAVYQSLIAESLSHDRGAIITSLKSISRIAMHHPAPKRLEAIPNALLHRVWDFLYVEDEELRCACLDFVMQFTSFSDNVEILLQTLEPKAFAKHLSHLLFASAREIREQRRVSARPEAEAATTLVPRLGKALTESLLKIDEPERSSEWLRMCFVPDSNSEMTQISLWQAYQGTFGPFHATHPHLIAGDFIKNVSTTFPGASAQVAGSNKYVIKGIKARKAPVDTGVLAGSKGSDKGKELSRCKWKVSVTIDGGRDPVTGQQNPSTTREGECGEWYRNSDEMLEHILAHHLQIPREARSDTAGEANGDAMDVDSTPAELPSTNGVLTNGDHHDTKAATQTPAAFNFAAADKTAFKCRWFDCKRTSRDPEFDNSANTAVPSTKLFARHIATHLPSTTSSTSADSTAYSKAALIANKLKHNVRPDAPAQPLEGGILKLQVLEDETGEAAGVPLRAGLVLRNIARFMPKRLPDPNEPAHRLALTNGADDEEDEDTKRQKAGELMASIFGDEVRERIFFAMTHTRALREITASILRSIRQSDAVVAEKPKT